MLTAEGHALIGEILFDALSNFEACEAVAGVDCMVAYLGKRGVARASGGSHAPHRTYEKRRKTTNAKDDRRRQAACPGLPVLLGR
ncbi:MAG: hypothetical protein U0165_09985 [Polyangiaceae bacterium]